MPVKEKKKGKKGQGNSTQPIFTACSAAQSDANKEQFYKSAICDVTKGTEVLNLFCLCGSTSPAGI